MENLAHSLKNPHPGPAPRFFLRGSIIVSKDDFHPSAALDIFGVREYMVGMTAVTAGEMQARNTFLGPDDLLIYVDNEAFYGNRARYRYQIIVSVRAYAIWKIAVKRILPVFIGNQAGGRIARDQLDPVFVLTGLEPQYTGNVHPEYVFLSPTGTAPIRGGGFTVVENFMWVAEHTYAHNPDYLTPIPTT